MKSVLKRSILIAALFYIALLIVCAAAKVFFMLFNPAVYSGIGFGNYMAVIGAGLKMDRTVAAYFTMPLLLILIAGMFTNSTRCVNRWLKGWYWLTSVLLCLSFVADTVLYSYWGFKLDTTPVFYFMSSPASAMASASVWQIIGAIAAVALLSFAVYRFIRLLTPEFAGQPYPPSTKDSIKRSGVLFFLLALLFIPVRGGVTVSTMNLSAVYFSDDSRLNHAAVNPFFSFLYSATHSDNFATAFPFFPDEEAERIFADATKTLPAETPDSMRVTLRVKHPDIYLIILESFSSHLFPSLGGEPVATGLDSVATSPGALLFSNIYASSFRTDRALTAILSGFTAQPTTSVMKHVSKAETLPSVSASLNGAGYTSEYFYGGDANFTNMKAYLASAGFSKILSDKDFLISEKLSKWGAHDDLLFERTLGALTPYDPAAPKFRVIQTSSSHEPFEVPWEPAAPDEPREVTAFRFTDAQVTKFINTLHSDSARWNSSLLIIVPDHYGCYPKNLSEKDAHRIPLIMTGGALSAPRKIYSGTGSQTDIAATLLALLGLPHGDFEYSRDLLGTQSGYAVFSSPNNISIARDSSLLVLGIESDAPVAAEGDTAGLAMPLRAWFQRLYRDISSR